MHHESRNPNKQNPISSSLALRMPTSYDLHLFDDTHYEVDNKFML